MLPQYGDDFLSGEGPRHHEEIKVSDIQNLLAKLPGILSVRLSVDDSGAIEAIHVLATTARPAQELARDIQNTLAARWGIPIELGKISVARVAVADRPGDPARLVPVYITANNDPVQGRVGVQVSLRWSSGDDTRFTGEATGLAIDRHLARIVAAATLDAMTKAVSPRGYFFLEDAALFPMAGRDWALVACYFCTQEGQRRLLSGSSPVELDPVEAVVLACLQGAQAALDELRREEI